MISGTTCGESISANNRRRPAKRARQNPNAARVPNVVARKVAPAPTIRLFLNDGSHRSDVKKSMYQRSERPGSGKYRNDPAEKESGTMTRIGAIRNSSTSVT